MGDRQCRRARVHDDALAVVDQGRRRGSDPQLLVRLESLADLERKLGLSPAARDSARAARERSEGAEQPGGGTEVEVRSNRAVVGAMRAQRIEPAWWAFGNAATRFKVFAQKGGPRAPYERVAHAAQGLL